MNIKNVFFLNVNSTYLYLFFMLSAFFYYLLFSLLDWQNQINSKILLKNLLESLDMDLPDELKFR